MGRQPCCDKVGLKKGPWTADEDAKLINFILTNGQCCWRNVPKLAEQESEVPSSGYSEEADQKKENEISLESSNITETKEEEKSTSTPFVSIENMEIFCTDEVPLIEPHEILVPCSSTSSSLSSSESSGNPEDLQSFSLDWLDNFWDELDGWDLLCDNGDKILAVDSPLTQYPIMVLDQESWNF
ncbi:hypothetical protein HHK36_014828 [Tetracentron sinense]|uniref:Myb-like domain-containing protein n=1 Tax=Tetracentron sinense TaxID=13715 RepID=A0A834Z640_TETSI|nr:hypothetical protein HHK36_014828 [Tetracentron sinense]